MATLQNWGKAPKLPQAWVRVFIQYVQATGCPIKMSVYNKVIQHVNGYFFGTPGICLWSVPKVCLWKCSGAVWIRELNPEMFSITTNSRYLFNIWDGVHLYVNVMNCLYKTFSHSIGNCIEQLLLCVWPQYDSSRM